MPGAGGAIQRMTILYTILHSADEHADDLPGAVLDCLAGYDIVAMVTIRGVNISVSVEGLPRTLH